MGEPYDGDRASIRKFIASDGAHGDLPAWYVAVRKAAVAARYLNCDGLALLERAEYSDLTEAVFMAATAEDEGAADRQIIAEKQEAFAQKNQTGFERQWPHLSS